MRRVRLGEVCTIEKGATGINNAIPGKYPLVVTSEERKSHNEYQFDAEAVVIPLVSSTGHGHKSLKRIHFQQGKFAVGSILCAIIPNDKSQLSAEYLYRYLDLNRDKELVTRMKGMANVTLPIKEIEQIEIPLPTLDEQHEFVKNYKTLEVKSSELSSELTHQLSLVKQLRQAFLREAMQGKLVPQDRNDEPASELLKKIKAEKEQSIKEKKVKKEKELPTIKAEEIPFEIPKSWVWCRLGEISYDLLGGFAFDSTRYSKSSKNQVIRLGNVKPDSLLLDASPVFIDDTYAKEVDKSELFPGDVLITMTGTRSKRDYLFSVLVNETNFEERRLYLNQRVGCFRFTDLLSRSFLIKSLKDDRLLEPVFESATGAANQANIGVGALKEILIPLPPHQEQLRIATKLDQLMNYCNKLEQSIRQSQIENEQLLQQVLREALQPKDKCTIDKKISHAAEA
jgi:type I restriction enzyme, S subunit